MPSPPALNEQPITEAELVSTPKRIAGPSVLIATGNKVDEFRY
jgi:hypothetical protein